MGKVIEMAPYMQRLQKVATKNQATLRNFPVKPRSTNMWLQYKVLLLQVSQG